MEISNFLYNFVCHFDLPFLVSLKINVFHNIFGNSYKPNFFSLVLILELYIVAGLYKVL